jgi:hypothetical protein
MLLNLLPGLRELRAPLLTGYTWLLAGYIAFEPSVSRKTAQTGIWHILNHLRTEIGAVGTGVGLSVMAYLVGAVSQGIFARDGLRPVIRQRYVRLWLRHQWVRRLLKRLVPTRFHDRIDNPISGPTPWGRIPHGDVAQSALYVTFTTLAERISAVLADAGLTIHTLALAARDELQDSPLTGTRSALRPLVKILPVSAGLAGWDEPDDETIESWHPLEIMESLQYSVAGAAVKELGLARTGLVGKQKDLFSVIDRLDAEAELRLTLAPSLLGLAAALGWRASPWVAAIFVIATGVLVMQGQARSKHATESVIEALRLGRTRIPLFDQIEEATEDCRAQLVALNHS